MKRGCLVVGAVCLGLVGGWLVWEVGQAREAARRSQCVGNLKGAMLLLLNYHSRHGFFPVGTIVNPQLPAARRLSWVVELWDELCSGKTLTLDRSKGWDEPPNWPPKVTAPPNIKFVRQDFTDPDGVIEWVTCPDDPGCSVSKPFPLSYVGVAGVGADAPELPSKHPRAGVFGYDRVTTLDDITDGTSTTMAIIETTHDHGPWTAGGPSSVRAVDPVTQPYIGPNRPFGGYHAGGANVAFADGSVRFAKKTIAPKLFEAIATIAGGEELPPGWKP
jgi:prepilin-type processing-associated H-X9-DG protein